MEPIDQKMKLLEQQIELRKQQIAASDERAKKFLELRMRGALTQEIADAYNTTHADVTNAILEYEKRYGLPSSRGAARKARAAPSKHVPRALQLALADERAETFRSLKLQGATLEEIGQVYDLSRERIRQLIDQYEKRHNLPSSIPASRKMKTAAKEADIKEYKTEQHFEKQKQYKRFVPSFQLDAHLVGRFLNILGNKAVLYGFGGKAQSNPKRRKDGTPYPSMSRPTNVFISTGSREGRSQLTLHSWVLQQCGVKIEKGQDCHHVDGDVTNNMLENLQVLSSAEHGRLTWQEQMAEGTIDFDNNPKRQHSLTDEQVEEIRALYQPRVTPLSSLAKTYGVNVNTIYNAIYGQGAYINVNPATCRVQKKGSKTAQELRAKQIEFDFGSQNT